MVKCLYCYKELNGNEKDFHKACSKKDIRDIRGAYIALYAQ